jgi:hypothetical protein
MRVREARPGVIYLGTPLLFEHNCLRMNTAVFFPSVREMKWKLILKRYR